MTKFNNRTVAAVIPVYNQKDLLLRAINSVLNQTIPCNEIIIVDDNSDFCIRDFLDKNSIEEVTVITNKKNMGPSYSRNKGVMAASSEFISFLDSDDYWHANKNLEMLSLLIKEKTSLAYAAQFAINKEGKILKIDDIRFSGNVLEQLSEGWIPPNPSSLMIKKSDYDEVGGMDTDLWSCEDVDFWIRLSMKGKKVSYSDSRLSYFSDDSDIRLSYNIKKRIDGTSLFLKKWSDSSENSNFIVKFSKNYWVSVIYPIVLNEVINKNIFSAAKLFIKFLLFNKFFYLRLFRKLLKGLKS